MTGNGAIEPRKEPVKAADHHLQKTLGDSEESPPTRDPILALGTEELCHGTSILQPLPEAMDEQSVYIANIVPAQGKVSHRIPSL
jgi:hypothetical protein